MFPIRDTLPSRNFPVMTLSLIVINGLVFYHELQLPPDRIEGLLFALGIVPAFYGHPELAGPAGGALGPLPFFTSMFLHGGWFHILSNMWILWIFGDNVEDRMGPTRFLLFYLICGVISGVVHMMSNPDSLVPTVGASGAIAGVMGAYILLYPHARVVTFIPLLFIPIFFEVPAYFFLGLWFVSQFFSGTVALIAGDVGGIAWWAHVGGFVAGMTLVWFFIEKRPRKPRREVIVIAPRDRSE